jgi:hypothetical protein
MESLRFLRCVFYLFCQFQLPTPCKVFPRGGSVGHSDCVEVVREGSGVLREGRVDQSDGGGVWSAAGC